MLTNNYQIDHSLLKYKKVPALITDTDGGIIFVGTKKYRVMRFRASGAEPQAYVALVFQYGQGDEKVIAATRGDIDFTFINQDPELVFTGDGKTLKIIITNDNATQSPYIGGHAEIVEVP